MTFKKGNKIAVGNSGPPPRKYTKEFIEKVAIDMLEWSKRPDAYFLESFVGDYPEFIDHRLFSEWAKEEGVFAESYRKVKQKLLGKLKSGSTRKVLDGNFVAKLLPLVDEDYRQWRREECKLESEAKAMLPVQVINYSKED